MNSLHQQGLGQCNIQRQDTKDTKLKSCYYDYYEKETPVSAGSIASFPNMVLLGAFSFVLLI